AVGGADRAGGVAEAGEPAADLGEARAFVEGEREAGAGEGEAGRADAVEFVGQPLDEPDARRAVDAVEEEVHGAGLVAGGPRVLFEERVGVELAEVERVGLGRARRLRRGEVAETVVRLTEARG